MNNPELVEYIHHRANIHRDIAQFIKKETENYAIRGGDLNETYPVKEWLTELQLDVEHLIGQLDWADKAEVKERLTREWAVRSARLSAPWNGDVGTLANH